MKMRKLLSVLLAFAMVFSSVGIHAFAADETAVVQTEPTGNNSLAYTKEVDGYVRVWGEGGGNASESFVLKLYSEDILLATTQLNNVGGIINGNVYVTWNFFYPESNDAYWTTTWEEGHPNSAAQPTHVDLIIDGNVVCTTDAKMSGADNVNPVVWGELGGVEKHWDGVTITNLDELKKFRDAVNSGDNYAGKTVTLKADINLNNEKWTPIGANGKTFNGTFDGGNNTISNLYVEESYGNVGLFGKTVGATLQNVNIHNASVKGGWSGAGALVGNAYTGAVKNINVTGKLAISATHYVGGINGAYSYAKYENCVVDGSNDEGVESYVEATLTGNYTNYVGGICGQTGEGGGGIFKSDVRNITLVARDEGVGIGGIAGVIQYHYSVADCTIANVKLIHTKAAEGAEWTGTIGGKDYSKNGQRVTTIINCTATNVTGTVCGEALEDIFWMGHDYTGTYPPYEEYEPKAIVGTDVTYDENGKINGGTLILIGNNDTVKESAAAMLSDSFVLGEKQENGSYEVILELPTATVTEIENDNLTFALNFKADEVSDTQLAYYKDWYADYVLTVNKDITFNANGDADGYLSGQYDNYNPDSWVNVPFEDVTLKAGESIKIMEYAAKLLNQPGLKLTYNDVYTSVQNFNCGVYLAPDYIAENQDLKITLELKMFNPEDETISYVIGETYEFEAPAVEEKSGFLRSFWIDNMPIITVKDSNGKDVECYQLGLFAGIDSINYQTAGFDLTFGSNTGDLKTKSLYTSITGTNTTITAEQLGEGAWRIFGKIAWIPTSKFNPETDKISFTPYVINMDGSKTVGEIRNLQSFRYQKGETE